MIVTSSSAFKQAAAPLLLAWASNVSAAPNVAHHDLTVELHPDSGLVKVVDRIRLSEGSGGAGNTVNFYLNDGFEPVLLDSGTRLERVLPSPVGERVHRYRVVLSKGSRRLTISYSGKLAQAEGKYEFGHVGPEGVYLTGASAWYPSFDHSLVTFSMHARAPEGWTVISQGTDTGKQTDSGTRAHLWRESRPQTDIVLLAGRFVAYTHPSADLDARVYLRRAEPALADRYLEAAAHYVGLYTRLIGPYPYDKFALVENFWETGYGLPSLALLGPRVIRFPFILHSSFPHEILHNWWGNGVYLEPSSGNWSEGLTAYLADHLVQAQRGRGAEYRRGALQKYASYVDAADDFPLSAFRGKHGEVSQAVGYNKTLMFFHMLRQRLGDETFLRGLRHFAERHRFKTAGYDELRRAFESASGLGLAFEFNQWVERTGAPWLRLSDVEVETVGDRYRVKGVIVQQQPGVSYRLRVPVAVQIQGEAVAVRKVISADSKRKRFELDLASRPLALHLDPEFDLFRRLAPGEVPASLGDLLGAKDALFILPAAETEDNRRAYKRLARVLGGGRTLDDTAPLPEQESIWLLGWDNAHLDELASAAASEGVVFTTRGVRLGDDAFERDAACVVMAARKANGARQNIGFTGCDKPRAMAGLARKVPHYSKYGFLAFVGDEPLNVRKDEWRARSSPMSVVFDPEGADSPPPLPARRPLSDAPEK